jgi:hypothetical protein
MPLERKVKSALNDNRLPILGAQVLFGFQFNGVTAAELLEALLELGFTVPAGGSTYLGRGSDGEARSRSQFGRASRTVMAGDRLGNK